MAIEDQRFYEHGGVDTEGILRAAVTDLEAGEAVEGGSTITQQLVRNLCIQHPEQDARTQDRRGEAGARVRRTPLASRQILGQYLNIATYGTVEGVDRGRGRRRLADLLLASRSGSSTCRRRRCSPGSRRRPPNTTRSSTRGRRRRAATRCCRRWRSSATSTRERGPRRWNASGLGLDVSDGYFDHREPYFFDYVEHQLIDHYGAEHGAPRRAPGPHDDRPGAAAGRPRSDAPTRSTNRPTRPRRLSRSTPATATSGRWSPAPTTPTSQFNLAAQGHRQPGSTFKAFVLTTAIKQGIDPYYDLLHIEAARPEPAPVGPLGSPHRRRGLPGDGQPAAGDGHLRQHRLRPARPRRRAGERRRDGEVDGDHDPARRDPGGGDRRPADRRLARWSWPTPTRPSPPAGSTTDPVAIAQGRPPRRQGRPPAGPAARTGPQPQRSPGEVTRLLHDNITEGTGTAAYTGCAGQAGKTGTTDEHTDAWFAGYQPNLATAVWVGYPESNDDLDDRACTGSPSSAAPSRPKSGTRSTRGRASPARNSTNPKKQIDWAPGYGAVHRRGARDRGREADKGGAATGAERRRTARPGRGRRL